MFGPAFKRNSRWSVSQPVPDVGNEETPYNAVDKFYDFWFAFKSWREFPHADEEDVEQAESREEKRYAVQSVMSVGCNSIHRCCCLISQHVQTIAYLMHFAFESQMICCLSPQGSPQVAILDFVSSQGTKQLAM